MSDIQTRTDRFPRPRPRGRWLMAHGAGATWRTFRADFVATPRPVRARMMWTLTAGLAFSIALMLALCFFARRAERAGGLRWEEPFLRTVEGWEWMAFSTALWAESPGNSVFMIPVILAATILCVWMRRPLRAIAVVASFFMLDLIVLTGWMAWDRARPVAIEGGIASPGFHSFPSGHVAQMVSAYGLFCWMWIRGSRSAPEKLLALTLWLAAVAVVGIARMRLGSHWPSDVAAGALVGAVWLAVNASALARAERAGGR